MKPAHVHPPIRQPGRATVRMYLLLLVLIVTVPLAVLAVLDVQSHRQKAVDYRKAELRTQVSAMVRNTGTMLADARDLLERLAQRPLIQAMDPAQCDPALLSMFSMLSGFTAIITVDIHGDLVCSTRAVASDTPRAALNSRDREWFTTALEAQRFGIGMPVAGRQSGKLVSVISLPVRDRDGRLSGFVALTLDLKKFDPNLADEALPGGSRYGFFAGNGVLMWRNQDPEALIGTRARPETFMRFRAVREGEIETEGVDGNRRFFALRPVPNTDWIAWVGMPVEAIYDEPTRAAAQTVLAQGAIILCLVVVAVALARRISDPIRELRWSVSRFGRGAQGLRVAAGGPEEIATVGAAFNEMADAIERQTVQLRIASAAFDMHEALVITDANGVIERMNRAAELATGYSEHEAIGKTPRLFKSGRHAPGFYEDMWRAITSAGTWRGEIWDKRQDGTEYPALLTISAVRDDAGRITHYIGSQVNISERKHYEEYVQHMAFHDGLTRLPNRRLLFDRLE